MSLKDATLAFALTLALHDLGALISIWLVMWIAASVALGMLFGAAAALGDDAEPSHAI